jgi:ParB-like nuclease domain
MLLCECCVIAGNKNPVVISHWFSLMSKAVAALPSKLTITYRSVGDLIPDPRNARTHPKRQIDQIRASIEAFGFTNPILADSEGHIIAGHGRLQAAQVMGLVELPVITLSGLSEAQKRMLRIADNKIALMPAGT